MNYAPIALFVYNRPNHTKQTIEALKLNTQAKESVLYIYSDAAKNDASIGEVAQVRDYIKGISGFAKVEIVEREQNWGLADSVIDGVTQLCNKYGRVIVIEDDLIVSPHFLSYMNSALEKYETENKVMQVSGYMFPVDIDLAEDALFMPLTTSWGWGTWKRAWSSFDKDAKGYNFLLKNAKVRKSFDLGGKYPYFKMLDSYKKNKVQSWAIRWYLSVFMAKGLILYPKGTLVENAGFDGSGVNCIASKFPSKPLDQSFTAKALPDKIEVSAQFMEVIDLMPKTKLNFKNYIQRLLKAFKSI